jgi:outer membrane protein OmpA-like peptidoglycan-associated protein
MMASYLRFAVLGLVAACASVPQAPIATQRAAPPAQPEHRGRIVVTETSIEILEMHFVGATAKVAPRSEHFLDNVAHILAAFESISLVEIQAYGSGAPPGRRIELANRRARTVIEALVQRGIDRARLRPSASAHKPPRLAGDIGLLIVQRTTPPPPTRPFSLP